MSSKLTSYIQKGEGKTIEFKEVLPSKNQIAKTVVAFSNTAGGKLILGIEDQTKAIKGLSEDQVNSWPDLICNIIYDQCYPNIIPEISIVPFEDKTLLLIEIYPGSLKPYYLKQKRLSKGVYIRVGSSNRMADADMIQELERQRMNISYDEEAMPLYSMDSLDLDKLSNDFQQLTGKKLTFPDYINLKLLKKEHEYHPTVGGMLLASRKTVTAFENACIKAARFKGIEMDEFIDNKEFYGPLYEQVNQAMNFAKQYIARHGKIVEIQRIDQYAIPLPAIREALINAVVHRDYSLKGSDIKFAIFDDRIEITSPGTLPKSIEIEDIVDGRSEIRNSVIARFFKEIKYIEQWGTGIRKMVRQCKSAGLKPPIMIESGLFFKIIFYKQDTTRPLPEESPATTRSLPEESPATTRSLPEESPVTTRSLPEELPATTRSLPEELSATTRSLPDMPADSSSQNSKKLIELIQGRPEITRKELAKHLGISEDGVKYHIKKLTQDGMIKRVGKKRLIVGIESS